MKKAFVFMTVVLAMLMSGYAVMANDAQPVVSNSSGPLGLPSHFMGDVVASIGFGLVLIVLTVIAYKFVDWTLKGVDFDAEISKNNVAAGIVVASIIIGVCYGVSNVVAAILH